MTMRNRLEEGPVLGRFLDYVRIDSRSDPGSSSRPSTAGQGLFADRLEAELAGLGAAWPRLRLADGSLLVRLPATRGREGSVGCAFLAHLDTYYGIPGAGEPRIVEYSGGEILLASGAAIDESILRGNAGKRLVVGDGASLLGADDKAGVAALMSVLEELSSGGRDHGRVDFWFTVDEEIGRIGAEDLPPGAGESWDILWTLDGEEIDAISVGDLAIRRAKLVFTGVDAHPCLHGADLVPAHYAAARFVDRLAELPNPMTSSPREPFFQVASIEGGASRATVFCRCASFDAADLPSMEAEALRLAREAAAAYGARLEVDLSTGSANFRDAVLARPLLLDAAKAALAQRGFAPREREIRGGTDGGLLAVTFPGLAAPDLGTGARNPHSLGEYLVVDELLALPGVVLDLIEAYAGMGGSAR